MQCRQLKTFTLFFINKYFWPGYSVDSIKRTVLLKVLSGSLSIKNTVFNSDFKKISIKNTVYQEKEAREKLNVRYV